MITALKPGPLAPIASGSAPVELLHELFEARAADSPDAIAVWQLGETLTYGELDRASNALARRLQEGGVKPGDHVGLLLPRSTEVYVALLAILKAGAAYVPLDPDYPADRVRYILDDCRAHSLITLPEFAETYDGFDGDLVRPDSGRLYSDEPLPAHETGVAPHDVCYVIYTSGTTGRPKGVQIEHHSACHLVRAESQIFGVGASDRVFQGFSIAFDASVEEVWLAFYSGAALVVGTREMMQSGPALATWLSAAGVTVFSTVPTLLTLMEGDLPTVRLLILGGEPCPPDLVTRWWQPGRRLVNTYGPTEATVIATFADCLPGRPVTIGRAVPGYAVHLLDADLNPVPPGQAGEICIGGPCLARGYVGQPALTHAKFVSDPLNPTVRLYRSGDLGRFNAEGEIEFLGRIDTQVKLRGFRIELSEIESALLECAGVLACAVSLREDTPSLPQLVAYAVPRGQTCLDPKAIFSQLRQRLPAYMIPAHLETLDALPTLPSGKVDRRGLPAPQQAALAPSAEDVGRSDLERKLAIAWQGLFAPLPVSLADHFFHDLGGHSLLAARMVSELRSDPELRDLSVIDLYQNPTVESLAAKLESDQETQREAEPVRPTFQPTDRAFWLCGLVQFLALYVVVGIFSLQWLAPYLTYVGMLDRGDGVIVSLLGALSILLAVYPAMLAISLATKWLVIGRFKPGVYPLYGLMYLRWWFVKSIVAIVPVSYMAGTPLLNWYYRLMGAKIGANVHLGSDTLAAYDLIAIGDDTCIGCDTEVAGFTVEGGWLKIGSITIGRSCSIGNRAVVSENTVIGDNARLDDLSLLPQGATLPTGEHWAGSPSRRVGPRRSDDHLSEMRPSLATRFGYGLVHLIGLFLFPVMVIGAFVPGVVLMNSLDVAPWVLYLLVAPFVAISFVIFLCLEIALVKWLLLGRVKPGRYPLHSGFYLRKWFVDQLMELSLDVIGPLYATIYLSPWYRLLGAKLGRRAEVSTASFLSPDLLTVGDEGFIADAVSLGAATIDHGQVRVAEVRVGRRSFVGNSALLPPGAVIGDNALIGCLSIPPTGQPGASAEGTAWLGSPAVFLPQRQESTTFDDERTFHPTRKLWIQRAVIEFLRVILPATIFLILTSELLFESLRLRNSGIETTSLVMLFPALYGVFGITAALIVVAFKWILMGRYRPSESPLWSAFVWRTELVTSLFENLAGPFLIDLLKGTPFLAVYLRLLGAKVGRRAFLNSSEVTEFDLVEIGDDVALNNECTIQTHLFEDRVMKMSTVKIGAGCSVGSQAVVLYDTKMLEGSTLKSLSLLMKGEVLPAGTHWEGSPARATGSS